MDNEEIDLLLTEFATEDRAMYRNDAFPYELLVRGVLSIRPVRPCMINVMSYGRHLSWRTSQESMTAINDHYGVTAISVRDSLLPIINPDNPKKSVGDGLTYFDVRRKFNYPSVTDLCSSGIHTIRGRRLERLSTTTNQIESNHSHHSDHVFKDDDEVILQTTTRRLSKMAKSTKNEKDWKKSPSNFNGGASSGSKKWQKKTFASVVEEPEDEVVWGPGDGHEKALGDNW